MMMVVTTATMMDGVLVIHGELGLEICHSMYALSIDIEPIVSDVNMG